MTHRNTRSLITPTQQLEVKGQGFRQKKKNRPCVWVYVSVCASLCFGLTAWIQVAASVAPPVKTFQWLNLRVTWLPAGGAVAMQTANIGRTIKCSLFDSPVEAMNRVFTSYCLKLNIVLFVVECQLRLHYYFVSSLFSVWCCTLFTSVCDLFSLSNLSLLTWF